jgi:hypothetical protein
MWSTQVGSSLLANIKLKGSPGTNTLAYLSLKSEAKEKKFNNISTSTHWTQDYSSGLTPIEKGFIPSIRVHFHWQNVCLKPLRGLHYKTFLRA